MIEITGCVLILLSSFLTGQYITEKMTLYEQILRDFSILLGNLEQEMTVRRKPLYEALHNSLRYGNESLQKMIEHVAENLSLQEGRSFDEIWCLAVKEHLWELIRKQEDRKEILELSHILSNDNLAMQRKQIQYYQKRFYQKSEQAAKECREKTALYQKLSAAAGIFLILILL